MTADGSADAPQRPAVGGAPKSPPACLELGTKASTAGDQVGETRELRIIIEGAGFEDMSEVAVKEAAAEGEAIRRG